MAASSYRRVGCMQSKQLHNRGTSGPTKAKVIASHMKQMIMVYSNPGPKGVTVNASYIINALKSSCQKRPYLGSEE